MAQKNNIQIENDKAHFASVKAFNLPLSWKFSVEIGNFIRHKDLKKSKVLLENVIVKKTAVPFKRFNRDLGHKPGISAGRFPVKASETILKLLESLEANAENKSLDTNKLIISEFMANKGNATWHPGRKRRRRMKRCHIFIKAIEKEKR